MKLEDSVLSRQRLKWRHLPAVFGLTSVFFMVIPEALAVTARPACELLVPKAQDEDVRGWQALGYQVTEKPGIDRLSFAEMAPWLDDHSYALIRATKENGRQHDGFILSLDQGRVVPGSRPSVLRAPSRGTPLPPEYSCENQSQVISYYRQTRRSLEGVLNRFVDRPVQTTHGELILDLESSYFVQTRTKAVDLELAKANYRALLEHLRPLVQSQNDFFTLWQQIRQSVYGESSFFKLRYCRTRASLIEAAAEKCTNCVGETYLLAALFDDLNLRPPTGWQRGLQLFSDHMRPVLYQIATRRTYDLVTGHIDDFQAAIFDHRQLDVRLWLGHGTLRRKSEVDYVQSLSPVWIHRDLACYWVRTLSDPKDQPSKWSGFPACGTFADGPVPEESDNESKRDGNFTRRDGNTSGSSGWSWKGLWNAEQNLFLEFPGEAPLSESLRSFVDQLIPPEKQAFERALQKGFITDEIRKFLSAEAVLEASGQGHLLDDRASFKRFGVRHDQVLGFVEYQLAKDDDPDFSMARGFKNRMIRIVKVKNPEFLQEILAQPYARRPSKLVEILNRMNRGIAQKVTRTFPELRDHRSMDEIASALSHFQYGEVFAYLQRLDFLRDFTRVAWNGNVEVSARSWTGLAAQNGNEVDPLTKGLFLLLDPEVQLIPLRRMFELTSEILRRPVELLRWIENTENPTKHPTLLLYSLLGYTQGLVQEMLRFFPFLDPQNIQSEWKGIPRVRPFENRLLAEILRHPRYFFTVKATEEEMQRLKRPFAPLQILDPRVRETPRRPQWPSVQLPRWEGASECPKGVYGLQNLSPDRNGISIAVDCGQPEGGSKDTAVHQTRDEQVVQGVRAGEAEKSQKGALREPSPGGFEAEGKQALPRPLTNLERSLESDSRVRDIPEVKDARSRSLISGDPRLEVELSVPVWHYLFESLAPVADRTLLHDSATKILLHHAYRHGLQQTFLRWPLFRVWTVFDTVDLRGEGLATKVGDRFSGMPLSADMFERVDLYKEERSWPFFEVALEEARAALKPGYLLLANLPPMKSEQELDEASQLFRSSDQSVSPARVLPWLYREAEGSTVFWFPKRKVHYLEFFDGLSVVRQRVLNSLMIEKGTSPGRAFLFRINGEPELTLDEIRFLRTEKYIFLYR